MRLLLDTHVLLWALAGNKRLGKIDADLSQTRAAVAASGFNELPPVPTPSCSHNCRGTIRALRPPARRAGTAEPMRLLTADNAVACYSDTVILL